MDIYVKKIDGVLAPADNESENIIAGLKRGECLRLKYSKPRNYKFLRKFFAMLNVMFSNQDHFGNFEQFRKWLTMKSGYYQIVITPKGKPIFLPDSIAFDSMDEVTFEKLYQNCIDSFVELWGGKISRDDLEKIVLFS